MKIWALAKKNLNFIIPLLLLIMSAALNFFSSEFIAANFPNRTTPDDLLFKIAPYIPWTQYLTDLANIFSFALIGYYIFIKNPKEAGYALSVYAFAFFIRAILIILTPLGGMFGDDAHYGLTSIHQHGMFPSGHTLMVILSYMLIDERKEPLLKGAALVSILIEIVSLILSRGHYSIDIVGSMLVAYFTVNYLQGFKKSLSLTSPKSQLTAGMD